MEELDDKIARNWTTKSEEFEDSARGDDGELDDSDD